MVVAVAVVVEMVVAVVMAVVDVHVILDVTVKSVTNVTKSVILLANARKMLIVAIVVMGLVTLLEIAVNHRTSRLAIHATELVIWPVTARMLRLVVVAAVVVIAVAIVVEIMIDRCLVILATRVVIFHATVQTALSHVTIAVTRDILVVNVPKMVAEIKK